MQSHIYQIPNLKYANQPDFCISSACCCSFFSGNVTRDLYYRCCHGMLLLLLLMFFPATEYHVYIGTMRNVFFESKKPHGKQYWVMGKQWKFVFRFYGPKSENNTAWAHGLCANDYVDLVWNKALWFPCIGSSMMFFVRLLFIIKLHFNHAIVYHWILTIGLLNLYLCTTHKKMNNYLYAIMHIHGRHFSIADFHATVFFVVVVSYDE